jgi:hypothetical protein
VDVSNGHYLQGRQRENTGVEVEERRRRIRHRIISSSPLSHETNADWGGKCGMGTPS